MLSLNRGASIELSSPSINPRSQADEVVVEAGYFKQASDQPVSIIGLSAEEIRRAPGTAGDVSRVIFGLPAVAKVTDTKNSLIVRGGGPIENGFYIDNIAIPNINHFPGARFVRRANWPLEC